jgi:hypothetical protein
VTIRDQLVEQALRLDFEDRAYIIDSLERSLPAPCFGPPKTAEEWTQEIDRRIEARERGEVEVFTAEETLQYARAAIEKVRQGMATP